MTAHNAPDARYEARTATTAQNTINAMWTRPTPFWTVSGRAYPSPRHDDAFDLTNSNGNVAHVLIMWGTRSASIMAWPAPFDSDTAYRIGVMADARMELETMPLSDFYETVHNQAACLGMAVLREMSRPLLREPDTSGES